jgi:hypothetical protein
MRQLVSADCSRAATFSLSAEMGISAALKEMDRDLSLTVKR